MSTAATRHFRAPQTVITRLVARQTLRGAIVWAIVFGGYVAAKAIGLVAIYPTIVGRQKIVHTYASNIGTEFLVGSAKHITAAVGSIVAWNTLGVMAIVGAIWGLLLATKYFRGEEDNGRKELLLTGQTTARAAAGNTLAGLSVSVVVLYIVMACLFIGVGHAHGVNFSARAAVFFALAAIAPAAMFMVIGAFMSQLLPTRGKAASVAAGIFGLMFLMRAIADITSATWLLNLTPLGWVEKLQPLSESHPIWLLPIVITVVLFAALTVYFAGNRDLGEAIFADKSSVKPHLKLLHSPLGAGFRLSRMTIAGWLIAILAMSTLYGLLTKSAAQDFSQSVSTAQVFHKLAHESQTSGIVAFLGVIFFLMMVVIMGYAASSMSAIRHDESQTYLDNFLVQPYSRLRWLGGRVCISLGVIVSAGILTLLGMWVGIASQHTAISFHTLLLATINALVPAVFTIGFAVFVYGIYPRLTSLAAYAVLAWSFLLEMLSSGITVNHWILDTSLLNHIAFAPAAAPHWSVNVLLVVIAFIFASVGTIVFKARDIQGA